MCVGSQGGGECNLEPVSSHAGIRHMAEDRRMSGQNSTKKREGDRQNKTKIQSPFWRPSENVSKCAQL